MWFRQLLLKEFLSLRPVLAVGIVALLIAVMGLHAARVVQFFTGQFNPVYPFLSTTYITIYFMVAYPLAAIIGYWQTMWEFGRGTWLFLLHRPRRFDQIVVAKMLAGSIITLALTALPALIDLIYISIPGVLPAPFRPDFTAEFWRYWCLIPIIHLGAFASGMRQAHWAVSRLMPMLAAIIFAIITAAFSINIMILLTLLVVFLSLQVFDLLAEIRARDFS